MLQGKLEASANPMAMLRAVPVVTSATTLNNTIPFYSNSVMFSCDSGQDIGTINALARAVDAYTKHDISDARRTQTWYQGRIFRSII
ncbi:hypothetical protein J1614_008827 [Plenodomus biglobosus]|nr:hypothetical protein J1614_008827 [Plenodomus biglobosus]